MRLLTKIPPISSLCYFNSEAHKIAGLKFVVLWLLASSPVIFAILLSPVPQGSLTIWGKFVVKLSDAVSLSEQFVYATSFVSPLLYIIYERYQLNEHGEKFGVKLAESVKSIFPGYVVISLCAIGVLVYSVVAFTASKVSPESFKSTFLYQIAESWALFLYLVALLCWYLSLLDSLASQGDFVARGRIDEELVSAGLAERVNAQGGARG